MDFNFGTPTTMEGAANESDSERASEMESGSDAECEKEKNVFSPIESETCRSFGSFPKCMIVFEDMHIPTKKKRRNGLEPTTEKLLRLL